MSIIITIIGRPNVGKSTLFNLLVSDNKALVSHYSGVTRDRNYGVGKFCSYEFTFIDTGGIINITNIKNDITKQTKIAIKQADIVLFIVDGKTGLTIIDFEIAEYLRYKHKETIVIVNKIDGISDINITLSEFYSLRIKNVIPVSATQKYGIENLFTDIILPLINNSSKESYFNTNKSISLFKKDNNIIIKQKKNTKNFNIYSLPIKIAIIGKPNVGKSTLINYLVGEERVLTNSNPGTTHDSIYIKTKYRNKEYIFIDTAGLRKRNKIIDNIEKISIEKSYKTIIEANIILLIIDSIQGISNQDYLLINFIIKNGKPLVIAFNKSDKLSKKLQNKFIVTLKYNLKFIHFVKIHFISALYGQGIDTLFFSINNTYNSSIKKISTKKLNNIMQIAINKHKPPIVKKYFRIKLKYAHIGGYNPLTIVIHGLQVKYLPNTYKRYLINCFTDHLNIVGVPIHLQFSENFNPFIKQIQIIKKNNYYKK